MAKKSIPSCRPGNSRNRTRSSKRCAPSGDRVEGRGSLRSARSVAGGARWAPRLPDSIARRVMGAWWSSRSSKPSSVRFTGRGKFDSCPLRQIIGCGAGVPAAARPGPEPATWYVFSLVGTSRCDVRAACSGATPSHTSVARTFVPPATSRAGTARRAIPTITLNTYATWAVAFWERRCRPCRVSKF